MLHICADELCSQQIELNWDPYGAGGFGCPLGFLSTTSPYGSRQALCCDSPEDVSPFLPVELDWLFPTVPPNTDIPVFNFTHIESSLVPGLAVGTFQPFGLVVIDGPADLVSSMSKRDGSHVQFLDCEPGRKHEMAFYTARYICTENSQESNCNDVHTGGAEGTIVKLPKEYGYATYGVVHKIEESPTKRIPRFSVPGLG